MSEQVVLDRRVIWAGDCTLKFVFAAGAVPIGRVPINYSMSEGLAQFPLHQLCTVQSASINNNTVSLNTRDVLPFLMRMNDKRSLFRYNGMCPNSFDTYGNYRDALGANNNPLGGYNLVGDNDLLPRGAFPVSEIYTLNNGVHAPQPISDGTSSYTVYMRFSSSEPLVLPPFIWADPQENSQGIYGVQNMNFVWNIGDCSRVFRSANSWFTPSNCVITVDTFANNRLIFNQLTPHSDDLMSSRNIVPYMSLPRFLTPYNNAITSYAYTTTNGVYVLNTNQAGTTLTSTNIQLNQICDKICIMVRKTLSSQNANDTDSALAIRGISINFNNVSGILSTASVQDLYRYSVEAGSNQSFQEFYGVASVANSDATEGGLLIPTTGSFLVLDFAKHINLQESYYAPGSLGNFQLQFTLNVVNQWSEAQYPNNNNTNWEIVLITVNSGLFATERGTSSSYTGLLTRNTVLDASTKEAHSDKDMRRMVGGGFLDSLKSVIKKASPYLPAVAGIAKHGLSMSGHPMAQTASSALGNLGYGRSGGGMSGGGVSGGRKSLSEKLLQ